MPRQRSHLCLQSARVFLHLIVSSLCPLRFPCACPLPADNAASLIYGTVVQYCTPQSCPTMAAGKAEYLWKDDSALYKKPTRIPAPTYIDLMMSEIDGNITDETIFPIEENVKFPRNYMSVVKAIYKRLFRLYAHIYCSHIDRIRNIGASGQ